VKISKLHPLPHTTLLLKLELDLNPMPTPLVELTSRPTTD